MMADLKSDLKNWRLWVIIVSMAVMAAALVFVFLVSNGVFA